MEQLLPILREWNKRTTERAKLQHAYITLVATAIVAAGLVTLVDATLGRTIVSLAGFLFLALLANSVIWALLKSFVIDRIQTKRTSK